MLRALDGCLAGMAATGPMTWSMWAADRLLPPSHQGELPPEQITEQVLHGAGAKRLAGETEDALASLGHYAFGAAAGAVLAAVARRSEAPKPLLGAAVGAGVWAASYLGWLPALRIRPSAVHEPAARSVQMIAAHLVWGAFAGSLLDHASVGER